MTRRRAKAPSPGMVAAMRPYLVAGERAMVVAARFGVSQYEVTAVRAALREAGVAMADSRALSGAAFAAEPRETFFDAPAASAAHLADLRAAYPVGPPADAVPAPAAPFRPAAVFPAGAVSAPAGLCADLTDGA